MHPVLLKEETQEAKSWQEFYPLQRKCRKHRAASPHGDFCKSAQYPRNCSRSVQKLNEDSAGDSSEDSESSGTFDTEEGPNEMEIFRPRMYNTLKCKTLTWRKRNNL